MTDSINQKSQELEALLFIYGEAMPLVKIAALLKLSQDELPLILEHLEKRLMAGGLAVVKHAASLQLVTKPEHAALVREIITSELQAELTSAALETLAIVLYAGPISRARIDYIRGVNSTFILRSLLVRGLVERNPDPAKPNAFLYTGSVELIRYLGLTEVEHLPEFAKYRETLSRIKSDNADNAENKPEL